MIIYGVAFLAFCTLVGIWVGELLGKLIGVPANVGGVGIAMLLLIGLGSYLNKSGWLKGQDRAGRRVLERYLHSNRGRHGRTAKRLWCVEGRADGDSRRHTRSGDRFCPGACADAHG